MMALGGVGLGGVAPLRRTKVTLLPTTVFALNTLLSNTQASNFQPSAKSVLNLQPDVNTVSYTIGCEARRRRLPYCDMIGSHMQTFLGAEV